MENPKRRAGYILGTGIAMLIVPQWFPSPDLTLVGSTLRLLVLIAGLSCTIIGAVRLVRMRNPA